MLVVMIAVNLAGGPVQLAALGAISVIGVFEICRIFKVHTSGVGVLSYLMVILYYLDLQFSFLPEHTMLFIIYLILLLSAFVLRWPKYHADQIMAAFFSVFYVAVMLSYIYRVRQMDIGIYTVWLIFLCSWGCDTCAYCFGMLFGKHKMAPVLSPKKSVEGAIGGVAGSMILTALFAWGLHERMGADIRLIGVLSLLAGAGALISMIGDLGASAIKRCYDVKDYGHIFPGHGGVLDRFDSVIITAPIIYYLLLFFA